MLITAFLPSIQTPPRTSTVLGGISFLPQLRAVAHIFLHRLLGYLPHPTYSEPFQLPALQQSVDRIMSDSQHLGGFLCGLGGAYITLVYVPVWTESVTGGLGWIAVALVIFSTWNPVKGIFGAYFFGMLRGLGFKLQNVSVPIIGTIPSQFLDMLPYIVTVFVLVFMTLRKKKENQPPAALGLPYFREDR